MVTPHINSKKNDFSELVIMSGDPLRVKYIAKNFLENCIKINSVRFMLGYTGYYKDVLISIMSHGMGIPSAAIYVEELIKFYNVKKIIRVGTCGTVQEKINLKDIIVAMGACTDSSFNRIRFKNYDFSAISDFDILCQVIHIAKNMNINIRVGNFFTTDKFYNFDNSFYDLLKKYKILGIDMETAGIYSIAAEYNIQAVSICSVSDHILFNKKLSIKEREHTFDNVITLALNTIIK
ncbi:purine-nucleoside phosphorylase [Buchnera aphidicola]|uniref:Purine nucleoside phosphorylase DeoD-type n=1 Tax=Buchnera aphidicola (Therioaphis trifolii) TaxID=1241884 RepID=A0A4D6YMF3_9GAMM|nr:purine-nucleoside phosphorylase [Buchnera aphidicola]QCI27350.1 purine-nucleoside phosphorylase [Buchnera aphidicola (Therioaphis trifolii)]